MTEQTTNGAAQNEQGPQFSLQRLYVRDLSFEAPKSPAIFRQEWTPTVSLDLNTRQKPLEGDFYEVVLTLSVTVNNGDEVAFIVEVQQALVEDLFFTVGTLQLFVLMIERLNLIRDGVGHLLQ